MFLYSAQPLFFSILFAPTWFTQGLFHPLQTPSHIILMISLGLLCGQQNKTSRMFFTSLLSFAITLIFGFIFNQNINIHWPFELILLVLALITSLLVILRMNLQRYSVITPFMLGGLVLGLNSQPIMIPGLGTTSIYNWLFGAALSILIVTSFIALTSVLLERLWNGIILRVLGSWIATSAIFVLTLMLAKH